MDVVEKLHLWKKGLRQLKFGSRSYILIGQIIVIVLVDIWVLFVTLHPDFALLSAELHMLIVKLLYCVTIWQMCVNPHVKVQPLRAAAPRFCFPDLRTMSPRHVIQSSLRIF